MIPPRFSSPMRCGYESISVLIWTQALMCTVHDEGGEEGCIEGEEEGCDEGGEEGCTVYDDEGEEGKVYIPCWYLCYCTVRTIAADEGQGGSRIRGFGNTPKSRSSTPG